MTGRSRIIFSQKLAGWLMWKGFALLNTAPDKKRTGRWVFFFPDTPELCESIGQYLQKE